MKHLVFAYWALFFSHLPMRVGQAFASRATASRAEYELCKQSIELFYSKNVSQPHFRIYQPYFGALMIGVWLREGRGGLGEGLRSQAAPPQRRCPVSWRCCAGPPSAAARSSSARYCGGSARKRRCVCAAARLHERYVNPKDLNPVPGCFVSYELVPPLCPYWLAAARGEPFSVQIDESSLGS